MNKNKIMYIFRRNSPKNGSYRDIAEFSRDHVPILLEISKKIEDNYQQACRSIACLHLALGYFGDEKKSSTVQAIEKLQTELDSCDMLIFRAISRYTYRFWRERGWRKVRYEDEKIGWHAPCNIADLSKIKAEKRKFKEDFA